MVPQRHYHLGRIALPGLGKLLPRLHGHKLTTLSSWIERQACVPSQQVRSSLLCRHQSWLYTSSSKKVFIPSLENIKHVPRAKEIRGAVYSVHVSGLIRLQSSSYSSESYNKQESILPCDQNTQCRRYETEIL